MKTMFKSTKLWNIVENGFTEWGQDKEATEELRVQDASALYLIQQGYEEHILIRIADIDTAHKAWEVLKTEYQGNSKTLSLKLYSLRLELEAVKLDGRRRESARLHHPGS